MHGVVGHGGVVGRLLVVGRRRQRVAQRVLGRRRRHQRSGRARGSAQRVRRRARCCTHTRTHSPLSARTRTRTRLLIQLLHIRSPPSTGTEFIPTTWNRCGYHNAFPEILYYIPTVRVKPHLSIHPGAMHSTDVCLSSNRQSSIIERAFVLLATAMAVGGGNHFR